MELIPNIKSYEWGKVGNDSEVANLAKLNSSETPIDATRPYAEWWMGDHISGPSLVAATGETLATAIARDPTLIGGAERLPFLLKVLSIGKALSIQVHPSKVEAEHLFRTSPDLYKDPNHKPELAIALTPFLTLCGFRPHHDLYAQLKQLEPLVRLLGDANIEALKEAGNGGLEKCFAKLMLSEPQAVEVCINELIAHFKQPGFPSTLESQIFLRLQTDFPNDVGSLSLFFLNVLQLQPGQAIFLPAQEPHAYLDGNCVECMACSDNVIRAGLTPKFKDVDRLLAMLNYDGHSGESKLFEARRVDAFTEVFVPPVKDFAVAKIELSRTTSAGAYTFANRPGGSLFIVLSGRAVVKVGNLDELRLTRGSVFFAPATSTQITLTVVADAAEDDGDFIAYQAMYNDFN